MKKTIQIIAFILVGMTAVAQSPTIDYSTPQEYFDEAAKKYIADDKLGAVQTLQAGLQKFEGDEEMRALAEELFKDMQQQQQQQQQQQDKEQENQENNEQNKQEQQQKQDQDQQGDQNKQDQQGDQNKQDQQGDQDKQDQQGDQDKQDQQGGDQDKQDQQGGDQDKHGQGNEDQQDQEGKEQGASQGKEGDQQAGDQKGQMVPIGVISKEDAERMLKAVNNSEKKVQAKVIKKKGKSTGKGKKEKDW